MLSRADGSANGAYAGDSLGVGMGLLLGRTLRSSVLSVSSFGFFGVFCLVRLRLVPLSLRFLGFAALRCPTPADPRSSGYVITSLVAERVFRRNGVNLDWLLRAL